MDKFIKFLKDNNLSFEINSFDKSTKTAAEAASRVGADVAKIGKSIVVMKEDKDKGFAKGGSNAGGNGEGENVGVQKFDGHNYYLFIVSGVNRINIDKASKLIGTKLVLAPLGEVEQLTGYKVGGIPPFGHKVQLKTYIDESLAHMQEMWCAAGSSNSMFKISISDIVELTKGKFLDIK